MIPRIIHQMAPADPATWEPRWKACQQTWLDAIRAAHVGATEGTEGHGPAYVYEMWTDERIEAFMRDRYSHLYETIYARLPYHIMRIDLARYMILYEFGGMYVDMDYELRKAQSLNDVFRYFDAQELGSGRVLLVESPFTDHELCQNSLMVSTVNHPFWIRVVEEIMRRCMTPHTVLKMTGPSMLSDCVVAAPQSWVTLLPMAVFNPSVQDTVAFHHENAWTRHHCSMTWAAKKNPKDLI
jgi:mannosyltransferase OCH1-like enzyme